MAGVDHHLSATKVAAAVPLVLDVAHQQGAIETERTLGEFRAVVEESRFDSLDLQRLDLPSRTAKFQPIITPRVTRDRIPQRSFCEKLRRFRQRFRRLKNGANPWRPLRRHAVASNGRRSPR